MSKFYMGLISIMFAFSFCETAKHSITFEQKKIINDYLKSADERFKVLGEVITQTKIFDDFYLGQETCDSVFEDKFHQLVIDLSNSNQNFHHYKMCYDDSKFLYEISSQNLCIKKIESYVTSLNKRNFEMRTLTGAVRAHIVERKPFISDTMLSEINNLIDVSNKLL